MRALDRAMLGLSSRRLRSLAALAALLVATAGAEAATPSKATVVLRGSQGVDKPASAQAPVPAPPPVAPPGDPAIGPAAPTALPVAPRFQDNPAARFGMDPAPRVGGLSLEGGGAQCRTACAESRYLCRASEEAELCDGAWGQCIASCTEASSNAL
jgi:hypothetical protein